MFNECPVDDWVARATQLGFNLVMLADADAGHADLVRRVADLVRLAHPRGAAVEAELGVLPCGAAEQDESRGSLTDPDAAAEFVRQTGVDLLAISTGNVHILLQGQRQLNLAHLAAIRRKVDVPLVLHGGSGIAPSSLVPAIALGVAKVNYGTYLKQRYLAALGQSLAAANGNPHHMLGDGGREDLLVVCRQAVLRRGARTHWAARVLRKDVNNRSLWKGA